MLFRRPSLMENFTASAIRIAMGGVVLGLVEHGSIQIEL
jgi:hypothetical protein